MQLNLDSSYYAYDTNGDLFTLHIKWLINKKNGFIEIGDFINKLRF
jgi:hypothetical protein